MKQEQIDDKSKPKNNNNSGVKVAKLEHAIKNDDEGLESRKGWKGSAGMVQYHIAYHTT